MRFSIVCYLDAESTALVRRAQEDLGRLTGARASLDLWAPHVTVGDGIEVNDSELASIKKKFASLSGTQAPFKVELSDIIKKDDRVGGKGEDTTPYGLYLEVQPNSDLNELVRKVGLITAKEEKWYFMPQPYHPHCALAFKDLDEKGFKEGINYLEKQDFELKATLDHVSLVEMLPAATREYARFDFVKKF